MTPRVGDLCIVVRATARPECVGRTCTCIARIAHAFGSLLLQFPNGDYAFGDPHNVRVIAPPGSRVATREPAFIEADV